MGYSPGFLLKTGQFSTLANSPEIDTKSRARSQNHFRRVQEAFQSIWSDFQNFPKSANVQNHGLQPRLFAQNRPIFDPCEFTRNRYKESRKKLEIILEGFRRRFRVFGAISRSYQNRPCSKPWAIAQAFCSKPANFRPLRIHPKPIQRVAKEVRNHFRRVQEAFQSIWSDFQNLPKSAMFKTMGYSPGFLLKTGQFSTLANSPEIDTKSRERSQKSFQKGLGGVLENLERFPGVTKIGHVQNHGLQHRLFAQNRPIFDPCEFTRNRHKESRKKLEIILEGFRRRFRVFAAISRTCQNRPCSKPWAIAQAFCSKPANFRPLRIHPKSIQRVAQGVRNHFRRVQEAFQSIWSDFQELPKSALFKTMGYSPGFLLKTGQFSTLANSPEIDTKSRARSQNRFMRVQEAFQSIWSDFQNFPKSAMFKTMGYSPGFLLKNGQFSTLANSPEIDTKSRARSQNHFRRVQEVFQGIWSDFQELPKSAMFKTMGYSPGFLLKTGQFSTLANSPQIDTNSRERSQKSFQKGLGGVLENLERFPGVTKIGHVQNHGLQPRLFAQNRPIFDPCEFTRNRYKESRKKLEIILEGFRRRFRVFGAISRSYQNRPCSKPWAIAQAFCSKPANFRPLRIHPKSTQRDGKEVRNHFRRVQEAFQSICSDFQNLPKSAMFKTMGYSPGFLLKTGQFSTLANSSEIDTNSRARSQKSFQKGLGGVLEYLERFPGVTKIGPVQNHGLQPRLFAQNRPIFDPCEFTRNRYKESRKELESFYKGLGGVLEYLERFPELAEIGHVQNHGLQPRLFAQKRPIFDPCELIRNRYKESRKELESFYKGLGGVSEYLQRFPELAKIGHVQNHGLQPRLFAQNRPIFDPCEFIRNRYKQSRKELEIILEGFRRRFRVFGAISRSYQNRPCSKPWAIAQAFCSKPANFRPLRIHPKSIQRVAQGVRIIL